MNKPATIGPYSVLDVLSQNRMTRVYRVRRPGTGVDVALKTFICMQLTDAEGRERFRREVLAGTAVHDPHVCDTLDWGYWQETTPYIVLELLQGTTLEARLGEAAGLELGLQWVRDALQGLQAIHQASMVHRGLHPDNLFVTREGPVKILDFGLARRIGWDLWTQGGTTLGRVPYVAPEQIFDARSVGPAADLYVLGMIAYRILAGRLPFDRPDHLAMMVAMTNGPMVPLATAAPDVPGAVCDWVHRLLAPQPASRYPSAVAALEALAAACLGTCE